MRKKVIFALGMLVLGIFIYYLYSIQFFKKTNIISSFIRNYIPDILWMLSFYFMSVNFSKKITKRYILFTAIYCFMIGLFFELLQLSSLINGTFDVFDIIWYVITIIIACFVEKYCWREKNEKI